MGTEPIIGWDVGGAHLKAARLAATGHVERVLQLPCPLWQGLEHFETVLRQTLSELGPAPLHAVTMTGEMADLFPNRREGVARIVAALRQRLSDVDLRFYAGVEGFVAADRAAAAWQQIASANWRASGAVVAARVPVGSFIDIGSTTTDILVVRDGRVLAHGGDDGARLVTGELVYTGVVRTPVMVLADRVPFEGEWVPVMAELFATTADVHRLTGRLPERADQHPAADGGDKTVAGSARRLARMIGRDVESAPLESWRGLADWLAAAQVRRIQDAWARLRAQAGISEEAPLVLAGVGRFLAPDLTRGSGRACSDFGCLVSIEEAERDRASDCAPAVAVAWLARQEAVSRVRAAGAPSPS